MKIVYLLFFITFFNLLPVLAGGIVTNTNQSAAWIRMPVRDASTDVDAVFYNPAGLTQLEDGFYIQLNNQTISQRREIANKFPTLNNDTYIGDVYVPVLPSAFMVYKKNKLALFAAFAVVGGGGGASYANGLPSFEIPISQIPGSLSSAKIPTTKYGSDIYFAGTSAYFGIELGGAYQVTDWLSLAFGFRYNIAKNTYTGHIRNILINPTYPAFGSDYIGGLVSAPKFFKDGNAKLLQLSQGATAYAAGLANIANVGGGALPLTSTPLSVEDVQNIQGIAAAAGYSGPSLDVNTAKAVLSAAAPGFAAKASAMNSNAAATADKEVEVEQNGASYTPIFGVNLSFLEKKLNIGIKYELHTAMKVKNKTKIDQTYTKADQSDAMFPDGVEIDADIPAMFSLGVKYQILPNFKTHFGIHYYFDRDAKYGKSATDDKGVLHTENAYFLESNSYEAAMGFEFDLSKEFALSVGYLYADTSPALAYQTDLSYSLTSHTIGFGGIYKITPQFNLELGLLYTSYINGNKDIVYNGLNVPVKETYYKSNVIGSIGLTYRF